MNVGVIPARLHSTRFPNKILTPINDKPMVVHVYEKALQAESLDDIIVAIDSDETSEALKPFKVNTVMTFSDHKSGTDRVAQVVEELEADVVVNIQGDEPAIDPQLIDDLVAAFDEPNIFMATVATTDISLEDEIDPNVVKVLVDNNNIALAFRREPRQYEIGGYYRHIGIYAFRKEAIMKFTKMMQTENEKTHKLEQLRVLDNGLPIHVIMTDYTGRGIDTEEDLKAFAETNG
ncbi:MAG: 3-deoxy-manno-octulosonate cytidylyltransferase [Candidatus Marinimicrobia bacterium]|nr:3-deoxy-manno-octulosonate cytidylyltransferase [Candidatus Neomarinimicrobiota bacterium]